ncbi:PPOX class F420-dependent oxidoreductase [Williamsia sp. MIQD14]|uniref:PPOX class F420-dependent oxidoreductase n=1 Tax=Williamsia sp. MIQD14 TaxID=3425703 RepID=UPI003DA04E87
MSTGGANPFGDIGTAKYVQLTTFTKSGDAKPLPIWAALDQGELLMWTQASSWKVKRIRNTPRVLLATCDRAGKNVGPTMEATARVLDEAGTARTRDAINRKYGLVGRFATTASSLVKGKSSTIGIAVTAN